MMAGQDIGFCTSRDGTRLAYATMGVGPPIVYVTGWPVHLDVEWRKPAIRDFLRDLAAGFRLVRYDMRGSGLSDREIADFSLDLLVEDVEAIVDWLELDSFALLSLGDLGGPTAIAYAAKHPARVTRLILNSAFARGRDIMPPERQTALLEYIAGFGFPMLEFTDAPGLDLETQRQAHEVQNAAATFEMQARVTRTLFSVDVANDLEAVTTPAVVLHSLNESFVPFELGREVAARLPRAVFVPFEGSSNSPLAYRDVIVSQIRDVMKPIGTAGVTHQQRAVITCSEESLTARETEVLAVLARGLSSRQIARELTLSVRTVERHVSNIYSKFGVHSRVEAAAYALQRGLVGRLPVTG